MHELTLRQESTPNRKRWPNMKNIVMTLPLLLMFVGCSQLKKLGIGSEHRDSDPIPMTAQGTATIDYQTIAPIDTNGLVRAWVKKPGQEDFRELNYCEYTVSVSAVIFNQECFPYYDREGNITSIHKYPRPAVPTGSQYRVETVR